MSDNASESAGRAGSQDTGALLARARAGQRSALDLLFGRHFVSLRAWARGRLPQWARRTADTTDLVNDALMRLLGRVHKFDDRGKGALAAYLRQSIQNRIRDEIRVVGRRPLTALEDVELIDPQPSSFEQALTHERDSRYRAAFAHLSENDQELIAGAVELGYSHEQLALATGRRTAGAARVALHRALRRLADEMNRV
jgi:RNA polymerase sigma factor (sigma-70 family)